MEKRLIHNKYLFLLLFFIPVFFSYGNINIEKLTTIYWEGTLNDTIEDEIPFPFDDSETSGESSNKDLYLPNPSNINPQLDYDPKTNSYKFTDKIGNFKFRNPTFMSFEEYMQYDLDNSLKSYWRERSQSAGGGTRGGLLPDLFVGGKAFETIFGSNTIDIRPQGSVELTFSVISTKRDDPDLLSTSRARYTNFDFDEKIQMNVRARIGEKIEFDVNYNTEATFDFENKVKLKYEGKEDEILQLVEAGDVTLPLNGNLITGSQRLFGIKTQWRFGRTTVTTVFSEQKAKTKTITVEGGGQVQDFNIKADDYDENKHFFIGHYFREHYEEGMKELPIIISNVKINKIEVWKTTIGAPIDNARNIVAFTDLGETKAENFSNNDIFAIAGNRFPDNEANTLFVNLLDIEQLRSNNNVSNYLQSKGFINGNHFEKVSQASKLRTSEFSFNSKLGYISLNSTLNPGQVLAVAFSYTLLGSADTNTYQVGEFSDEGIIAPNSLIVKLLRSTTINTKFPLWDLMMKNVYSIGSSRIESEDFIFNVVYSGNVNGVPTGYLNEGPSNIKAQPLIKVMRMDRIDYNGNPPGDGIFDFIDNATTNGGTIDARKGKIFFPVLEPFGSWLRNQFGPENQELADKYCFDSLYTNTIVSAQQFTSKNKFFLEGSYKSSTGSEISLNAINVPEGSVRVSQGGSLLKEGEDYLVDYTLGKVTIIKESIMSSGTPINVSLESEELFRVQTQRLMGAHFDYYVNEDFAIGATIMNLHERPITQKTNFGNEPISNTIWGLDAAYQTDSRFITKMVDKLPFVNTKAKSKVNFEGEFAHFLPGHSRAIGETGTSYIDDFEGTASSISLDSRFEWQLSSVPQKQSNLFPEAEGNTGLQYGFNRAAISWYSINATAFHYSNANLPSNIDKSSLSNHFGRQVKQREVFPNRTNEYTQVSDIQTFSVAYYPMERGPYNYDVNISQFSNGIDENGLLNDPESRWGGIMREIRTSDFQASNIEYIEFWLLDPFVYEPNHKGGKLYFNLGDISEDVLKDGKILFESGLPAYAESDDFETTIWGKVGTIQPIKKNEFDSNIPRDLQDVGFDGLRDEDEEVFFGDIFLNKIANSFGATSTAYLKAIADPSSDNYHSYLGGDYDVDENYSSITNRYARFNMPEGNSPTSDIGILSGTAKPDYEDVNEDNTLNEAENYYQYEIDMKPEAMIIGENYITDIRTATVSLDNGEKETVKWYQFKIPVQYPDQVIGDIEGFNSIRFMRLFLKDFSDTVILRFAELDLVRNEWRRYDKALRDAGDFETDDISSTFELSSVSIEENDRREPINYVIPPGIEREMNVGSRNLNLLNEQALAIDICELPDGISRAAYKITDLDLRRYGKLKMYIHAESALEDQNIQNNDLSVFIRIGADYSENYYEYEVPLTFTQWGDNTPSGVWPENNTIELELKKLIKAKQQRNDEIGGADNIINLNTVYSVPDGKNIINIKGTPSISDVRVIMIGVKNPKKRYLDDYDDGFDKCAEIWVNELRLTDFDNHSGWASTARLSTNLADLGSITLSGSFTSAGFGSIEKKVNERLMENISQFDIATNIDLGKLLPEKAGIRIPMHFDYGKVISNPEFDPLNPDIEFKQQLKNKSNSEKKEFKQKTQSNTTRKNINFINVRKDPVESQSKLKLYSVENFNLSYAYSEISHRDVDVEHDIRKTHRGGLGYIFNAKPKEVKPFNKLKFLGKSKWLALIKDFNFNYLPKTISLRSDMDRQYNERLLRNKSTSDILIDTTFFKKWDWNRMYDLRFDITRSIKLDFTANANSLIDEPRGAINRNRDDYQAKKDTIIDEILSLGRINRYNQQAKLDYTLPLNKIPLLNWLTARTSYTARYTWSAQARSLQERLGNTIESGRNININGNVSFRNLFNKIGYLNKLHKTNRRNPRYSSKTKGKSSSQNSSATKDSLNQEQKNPITFKHVFDNTLRILTGFKSATLTYSTANTVFIPGFQPEPNALGNRWTDMAPGMGFVFGYEQNILDNAVRNSWITTDSILATSHSYFARNTETFSYRATYEPFQNIRINFTGNKNISDNIEENIRAYDDGSLERFSSPRSGSFSMSYILLRSSFEKLGEEYKSNLFDQFLDNRIIIANRLAAANSINSTGTPDSLGFPDGYSGFSPEVLIGAFISAYSKKDAIKYNLDRGPFLRIPLPNWSVNFSGLNKIEFIKNNFRSINITHRYTSSYNLGGFASNLNFQADPTSRNGANNFYSEYDIGSISFSEQFGPLINIDFTLKNDMLIRAEIRKNRNLSMSFVNNQLNENKSTQYIIGIGYRFKSIPFTFKPIGGGKKKKVVSDLNTRIDISLKDDITIIRRISEGSNQVSSGGKNFNLNMSADYTVNQRLNIRFFFDKIIGSPYLGYRNSTTKGGISLRFTIVQ